MGSRAYPETAQIFKVPLLSQKQVKLQTSNSAITFIYSTKAPLNTIAEKRAWVSPLLGTCCYLSNGKATNFKFCKHFHTICGKKSPLTIWAKVAVGIVMDSEKFPGHPYIRCIAQSSCDSSAFLFL